MSVSLPFNPQTSTLTPAAIIKILNLKPHPEGGYFAETFRDTPSDPNSRALSTMIYFLIEAGNFSHIHRLDAAEAWHFYAGQPLNVIELTETGARVTRLGVDFERWERPQYVVKGGTWFGSKMAEGGQWALVGCTVAPGFEFEKFELGRRAELVKEFPRCEEWIQALTKEE